MVRFSTLTLSAVILAGCAGAGGPIYEFRPTETPLRYQLSDHGALSVDTPVGEQTATDSSRAVVVIEIAGQSAEGREVVVSFDALELWSGGDFPKQHVVGDELVGQPFAGVLDPAGTIVVTEAPELSETMRKATDPAAVFADLLPALPPAGDEAATPWPHRTTMQIEAPMSVEVSYDGTASFAGDTIWNGEPARVIAAEGITTAIGRGTPAGSPGEVEFKYTGRYVARYIWDPVRGVMLAASRTTEADGELEVREMQMIMPITYKGRREVTLRR